jgi:SPP1 gp7 family putative phage head morphogenesis protein
MGRRVVPRGLGIRPNHRTITIHVIRRRDPSNTGRVRARFEADAVRRFEKVARAIRLALVVENVLYAEPLQANRKGDFAFTRGALKAAYFMQWLRELVAREVLEIKYGQSVTEAAEESWANVYIDTAYQRGIREASAKLKRGGVKVDESWIAGAFNRPIHADRVGIIYSRTFQELKNVTYVMDQQIGAVLAEGMAEGRGPLDIARRMVDRVDKIGKTRAKLIARTEVINAHAEATLNSYTEAGVNGVEVDAEFSTAGDDQVCPECEALEGQLFTLSEARDMIPVHPNCRCAWLPRVVGGSGITLNWKRHAPRPFDPQRSQRRAAGAVRGPHAHRDTCGHRSGGRT